MKIRFFLNYFSEKFNSEKIIPFRDVIISDGLISSYNMRIGPHMAAQFKDLYMKAKREGKIIRSF